MAMGEVRKLAQQNTKKAQKLQQLKETGFYHHHDLYEKGATTVFTRV